MFSASKIRVLFLALSLFRSFWVDTIHTAFQCGQQHERANWAAGTPCASTKQPAVTAFMPTLPYRSTKMWIKTWETTLPVEGLNWTGPPLASSSSSWEASCSGQHRVGTSRPKAHWSTWWERKAAQLWKHPQGQHWLQVWAMAIRCWFGTTPERRKGLIVKSLIAAADAARLRTEALCVQLCCCLPAPHTSCSRQSSVPIQLKLAKNNLLTLMELLFSALKMGWKVVKLTLLVKRNDLRAWARNLFHQHSWICKRTSVYSVFSASKDSFAQVWTKQSHSNLITISSGYLWSSWLGRTKYCLPSTLARACWFGTYMGNKCKAIKAASSQQTLLLINQLIAQQEALSLCAKLQG